MNIMIAGRRTSMRLEPTMWDALEDIARREGLTVNGLCTQIKDRLEEQIRRRGPTGDNSEVTLTSAVRVFIAAYFRRACTEDGHVQAGHGGGDPFVGTPFDLPPLDELDQPEGGSGATASAAPPPAASGDGLRAVLEA
ncbi:ribbon-helix-helix domain-containing protein [Azospirillum isscasi]|uniref:Ribbon-helix-helix domain-containing protein n=1 Tax=Azospirillum isscasi TaxID=3053926 RepID=A0ABU0WG36_9PROT|nr:ribbon-helix-helix domain-containing protein [Azospirillum isscasi]MDQ2103169.1 ribbon-helix-helix domain-containing protein [Azospirillum isscasi]